MQQGNTSQPIAVSLDDHALFSRVTVAQAELEANGTLPTIRQKWLADPATDQSSSVH
ncbi:hypothetical protein [Mycobacterium sp.]|uniref:hypothetical protein n=1 Tax=Mycobacterium sp. TaxID=1785 RepID=UPI0039C9F76E